MIFLGRHKPNNKFSRFYKQTNKKDHVAQLLKYIYSELRAINLYMEGAAFSVYSIC